MNLAIFNLFPICNMESIYYTPNKIVNFLWHPQVPLGSLHVWLGCRPSLEQYKKLFRTHYMTCEGHLLIWFHFCFTWTGWWSRQVTSSEWTSGCWRGTVAGDRGPGTSSHPSSTTSTGTWAETLAPYRERTRGNPTCLQGPPGLIVSCPL